MEYSMSCVVPAYNEGDNIEKTITELKDIISGIFKQWEIVIINDGSKDNTEVIIRRLSEDSRIRLVSHAVNKGYGAALKTGFLNARYDLVLLLPADGQFELTQIPEFLEQIENSDIVLGRRKHRKDNLLRRLNGFIFNLAVKILFGLKLRDIDCGFKLYRRYVFNKIKLICDGALIDTEFFYKAKKNNFRVKQINVLHKPRMHGASTGANLKVICRAMREIIWLWFKLRVIKELET